MVEIGVAPPMDLGEKCRKARVDAGVSLRDMADRTHRDAGALSRFENGKSTPRDLDALLAQYTQLQRIDKDEKQQSQQANNRQGFIALYLLRWIALGFAFMVLVALGGQIDASDALRVFVVISWVILMVVCSRLDPRHFLTGPRLVVSMRGFIPGALLSVALIERMGDRHLNVLVFLAALFWIELGFWAWEFDLYKRRA